VCKWIKAAHLARNRGKLDSERDPDQPVREYAAKWCEARPVRPVGALLRRSNSRAPQLRHHAGQPIPHEAPSGEFDDVQFVPARWLVLALSILMPLLTRRPIGKFSIAAMVWSFAPRRLKIAATGFAVAATTVFVGAIAAITLLALQLT
jgi:hypothetical protein